MGYKKHVFIIKILIISINLYSLEKELIQLSKSLEKLTVLLKQQSYNFEALIEQSGYYDKKISVNNYPVYFLKVLRQGESDCQLHALKNAVYGLKLLNDAPSNIQENLTSLNDKNIYEKLVSEWTKITRQCRYVSDEAIKEVIQTIKNKKTPPQELHWTAKHISFFEERAGGPVDFAIMDYFEKEKEKRIKLFNEQQYIHAFLVQFTYKNKSQVNKRGGAEPIFEHTFALLAHKANKGITFFIADSWYGDEAYATERNSFIENVIRVLTMQDEKFYQWYTTYLLGQARIYSEKISKAQNDDKKTGYWVTAIVSFKEYLKFYIESEKPLTEEQKNDICTLANILIKTADSLPSDEGKKRRNLYVKQIKERLESLKIKC